MTTAASGGAAAAVGFLVLVLALSGVDGPDSEFEALLGSPSEAAPTTRAETVEAGTARLIRHDYAVRYRVRIPALREIRSIHIHAGSGVRPGPVRVHLFDSPEPVDRFYGPLEGSFGSESVRGGTLESLVSDMAAGRAYLDVHTGSGGVLTGQIRVDLR